MGKISNAWRLAKSSWAVLSKDRELVIIPVVSGIVALVALAVIGSPAWILLDDSQAEGASNLAAYLIGLAALVVATWIVVIGEAAVIAGAGQRMDGDDPTVASAFATARTRVGRLFGWAAMATVVSVILDVIRERFGLIGRLVSWGAGVAFRLMSFLALPIIVFEDVGAIEAFKRSSALLKRTWGEQIGFNFGLGLLSFVAILPGVLVGGGLAATGILPLVIIGVAAMVIWVVAVFAVTSALSAVFKTALYRYAKGLPVDPVFDASTLAGAIGRR